MTVRKLQILAAAWCCAALVGCADEEGALEVAVSTDHLAGTDFVSVRAALFDNLPSSGGRLHLDPVVAAARTEDDWEAGVVVARFDGLERRRWAVQAELLDADGAIVGAHAVSTTVRGLDDRVIIRVVRETTPDPDGGTEAPDGGGGDSGAEDAGSDDGGPGDDGGDPADAGADAGAGATAACHLGIESSTIAFYDFEEDGAGTTLTDTAGGHHGTWNGGEVRTEAGPASCGQVLRMPADGTAHGTIAQSGAWNLGAGSVDFWVRVDEAPSELVGMVGRDESGTDSPGHLSIWLTRERVVVVRLQNTDGTAVRCHGPVSLGGWHHVGVAFGGGSDLQVWLDGVEASRTGDITVMNPDESVFTCGGSTTRGIRGNTNPWVVGANTAFSAPGSAGPLRGYFRGGAIDRVRIGDGRRSFAR